MESMYKIYAAKDNRIQLKIFPGHFATTQSHITHCLDMVTMKSRCSEAQRIADVLAALIVRQFPGLTVAHAEADTDPYCYLA